MKKLAITLTLFAMLVGCNVNIEGHDQINKLESASDFTIFYHASISNNWYVSAEIETICGKMEVEAKNSNLADAITDLKDKIDCLKKCE